MNILQICAYAAPYGGNFINSLSEIDRLISDNGGRTVYAFPENAQRLEWVKQLQKTNTVYFLPLVKARIKPNTYVKIRKIAINEKIDIIHSHFELYDIPAVMAAPRGVKIFFHLHDAIENTYNSAGVLRKLLFKMHYGLLSNHAYVISVSDKHREFAIKLGMKPENAVTVLNGIDTSRIKPYNSKEVKKEYDFLIFGWELKRKAVDLALNCAEKLYREEYNFTLAVVGVESTWNDPAMLRYKDKEWLKEQGFVDDVNELYQKSKCFLHISRAEGCSYALEEAMYSGIPVICSNISENMIAEKAETVDMIECNNEQALYSAMKRQLNNVFDVNEEAIKQTREYIETWFSVEAWANNIYKIYLGER